MGFPLKYGLGKADFVSLRERGFVYVDKTQFIIRLLEGTDCYFLSRPRRFGKSLFISTLECFFQGRKDLFEELAIENYDWDWSTYPVIRIDLSNGSYSEDWGVEERLNEIIAHCAAKYGVAVSGNSSRARFTNLIYSLNSKYGRQAVVLIDEYEKPLLDSFHNKARLEVFKGKLRDFYSVLKDSEPYLRFVFITGVTRFGHLNIFSGLNNLTDISLYDDFADICGITENEIEKYLWPGVEQYAKKQGLDTSAILLQLKNFYDGYHFSKSLVDIYNPFSLMESLLVSELTSKWFLSGSSSFLIDILRRSNFDLAKLEGIQVSRETLLGDDAYMGDIVPLMYQSGYITIKSYDKARALYSLGFPNVEVKEALFSSIIPYYLGTDKTNTRDEAFRFVDWLKEGKAREAMEWLKGFFSSIPNDMKLDRESDFQNVIYSFFALAGLLGKTELEKHTSDGIIDMIFQTDSFVYVFEFKRGDNAKTALDQINAKEYAQQWCCDPRKVIKIGVAFSPAKRGIAEYIIEN